MVCPAMRQPKWRDLRKFWETLTRPQNRSRNAYDSGEAEFRYARSVFISSGRGVWGWKMVKFSGRVVEAVTAGKSRLLFELQASGFLMKREYGLKWPSR